MRQYLSGESRDGLSFEKEKLSTKHLKSYSIRATGHNSATKSQTNTGHELQSDVPKSMGGGDAAPQPVEHLLAALIGCTQATAMFVGRSMSPRLSINKLEFDIKANRDNRGALQQPINKVPAIPSRLQAVSGTVKVFLGNGRALSQDELDLLAWQTEVRCPVANMMMASGCKMDIQWIDGSACSI
eukprot:CAMPEP_0116019584 /NCGR_PEP_ID=MMETSP0321-20121206/9318_1 /TAXON_ID=163516 /ORGANISM="Leptocylindrus danicus var. danicus, Strain B650" /LENGTH=184 /DNA_ID=CAMNT_0003490171 /DNA_START=346 /DNA_END=900 /DNA_ORIENTATION=-